MFIYLYFAVKSFRKDFFSMCISFSFFLTVFMNRNEGRLIREFLIFYFRTKGRVDLYTFFSILPFRSKGLYSSISCGTNNGEFQTIIIIDCENNKRKSIVMQAILVIEKKSVILF